MVFNNSILLGAAGQGGAVAPFDSSLIGNSVWLNGSDEYLNRTPSSAGNRTRWTLGWWFQLNAVATDMAFFSANNGSNDFFIRMDGTSNQNMMIMDDNASMNCRTVAFQRDVGWYHCIMSYDSNQGVAKDRIQIYLNGERQEVSFQSAAEPSSGGQTFWNNNQNHEIGRRSRTSGSHANAYMAQIVFLDADSIQNGDVAVSDFLDTFTLGTNGFQFVPKSNSDIAALATAAGGNSFCLDFADTSNFGNDISGNSPSGENDFTANNMSSANQSLNTPSNVYPKVSNIGIPNNDTAANYTMTSGSNRMVYSGSNQTYKGLISTQIIQPTDPAIYWELYLESGSVGGTSGGRVAVGLAAPDFDAGTGSGFVGAGGNNPSIARTTISDNGSAGSVASLVPVGGVQNLAYEPSTGKIWFGVDGTWNNGSATASTTLNPSSHDHQTTPQDFAFFLAAARSTDIGVLNFGDNPTFSGNETAGTNTDANGHGLFKYAVPSGFLAPNSANLTAPDFQGKDYFDATVYEGNGTGQRVGDFVPFTDVYTVDNSAMFDDGDTRILSKTFGTADSLRKMTFSTWAKWTNPAGSEQIIFSSGTSLSNRFEISFASADNITIFSKVSNSTVLNLGSDIDIADMSQWVNIVISIDTDQSSTAERYRLFVDGVQQTLTGTDSIGNADIHLNSAIQHNIGGRDGGLAAAYFDGYFAETVFIDNARLDASSFGQLDTSTNRWVPKSVSGLTFGANGFYLEYKVATGTGSGAGTDTSGRSNNFAEEGTWATSDQFVDTPSLNFATIDPAFSNGNTPLTISQGNLQGVKSSSGFQQAYSNLGGFRLQENTGIYFAEVLVGSDTSNFHVGVLSGDPPSSTNRYLGQDSNTYGYAIGAGQKVNDGTYVSYGAGYTAGDVIGIEIDTNTGSINFYKNGADQGQAFTEVPGPYAFAFASESGGGPGTFNFGQQMVLGGSATTFNADANGRFKHTPPTGAKALNQDNLDDTASKLTAWAWIKNRDATDSHMLIDRVRGVGVEVHTDGTTTTPETTNVNTVQRFFQRGVQVGNDVQVNTANESYVLWQWLVGDSATTGTANTQGSLNSTVLAADAGHFSVVSWTGNETLGATIGHGMGGEPEFIIAIARAESGENKPVYHKFMTSDNDHLKINEVNAQGTAGTTIWDVSAMSSTLIGLGAAVQSNSNNGMIAYCFRNVPGVCKVGKYTGNGASDGPYVGLGFTPRWIFSKRLDSSSDGAWWQFDTGRDTNGNVNDLYMRLNGTNTEPGAGNIPSFDFLSNGFKSRSTYAGTNASSSEYLYMAMADIGGNGTLPPIYGR